MREERDVTALVDETLGRFDRVVIARDVRTLYSLNYFDDIKVYEAVKHDHTLRRVEKVKKNKKK